MDALLIVDLQVDFCPGGALGVAGGDEIVPTVNRLITKAPFVVACRDWHPADHGSFVGVEVDDWEGIDPPSVWPPHCVAGTPGAAFHADLHRDGIDLVVDKGMDPRHQGYSAFHGTGLAETLAKKGVSRLVVVGIATDYCVLQSTLDARDAGIAVDVVADAVRAVNVNPGDDKKAFAQMSAAGARIIDADDAFPA